jgi:hypothetical protein
MEVIISVTWTPVAALDQLVIETDAPVTGMALSFGAHFVLLE